MFHSCLSQIFLSFSVYEVETSLEPLINWRNIWALAKPLQ